MKDPTSVSVCFNVRELLLEKLIVSDIPLRERLEFIVFYSIFILSTITPCTTGLKIIFDQSDCTSTANSQVTNVPLTWKTQAQLLQSISLRVTGVGT